MNILRKGGSLHIFVDGTRFDQQPYQNFRFDRIIEANDHDAGDVRARLSMMMIVDGFWVRGGSRFLVVLPENIEVNQVTYSNNICEHIFRWF